MAVADNFFSRMKKSFAKAADCSFANNIGNIILIIVAVLLLISLLMSPAVLIALALLGLFLWALLYY